MKRTFYELFGVLQDARQDQLEAAYERQTAKLNAAHLRGGSEAVLASKLLREGYQILSDPAQRARYDAKLAAAHTGVDLMFFAAGDARRKGAWEAVVLAVLVTVLGSIIYYQVSRKVDQVRIEHAQAVIRQQEEKARVITIDATQSTGAATSVAFGAQKPGIAGKH